MGYKVITIIVLISSPYFLVGQISKLPDEKRSSAYFQLLVSKSFILTPNFRTSGLVDILVQKKLLNEEVSPQIFS